MKYLPTSKVHLFSQEEKRQKCLQIRNFKWKPLWHMKQGAEDENRAETTKACKSWGRKNIFSKLVCKIFWGSDRSSIHEAFPLLREILTEIKKVVSVVQKFS